MRICFVVSTYEPDTIGGQGEVVLKLQKNLLERSIEAYVITAGQDVAGYPNTLRTRTGTRLFNAVSSGYVNWIRRMKFDAINVHHDSGMGVIPLLKASDCQSKIVTTLHVSYLREYHHIDHLAGIETEHAHPSFDEYAVKYLLTPLKFFGTYIDCTLSDKIVAVCAKTRDDCSVEYRIPRDKTTVIHNGVDLDEFNPRIPRASLREKLLLGEKPVVLTVGTTTIRKGTQYLLRSVFDIAQKHPDVKLIIVGSKRYLAQLQSLAAYLGIQQNVIFAGPITRQELPLYYAACDIVALPSTYEGFPVVALEALASGKPVVASRVGGIPEAIKTGSNGILFEAGDISALTEGLLTLLENRTLRDDMAHNARKIAEKEYNWKQITDKYITEFQRLL